VGRSRKNGQDVDTIWALGTQCLWKRNKIAEEAELEGLQKSQGAWRLGRCPIMASSHLPMLVRTQDRWVWLVDRAPL
jgi:hypothetical protein